MEVDYAIEVRTGEIRRAWVFVAGLGLSQLLLAWAAEDMNSRNWLSCHRRMFAYYGGRAARDRAGLPKARRAATCAIRT